jgi:multiple sugar transport system substrate-binding protein
MLQSGSGIDTMEVRDITAGPWSTNGWLYDMSKDLKGWSGWDALTDNAVKYSKDAKNRTYYIPYGFYGLSLYYRTDLVSKAGFKSAPTSWDELLTQATAIQNPAKRQYGYAFRGGTNANSNATAVIEAYVADKIDRENGFKLTRTARRSSRHRRRSPPWRRTSSSSRRRRRRRRSPGATRRWSRASPTVRRPSSSRTPK